MYLGVNYDDYQQLTKTKETIVDLLAMPVAQRCAKLHVPDPRSDRDAIIAATALVHGMTVVTRNVTDFDKTGVEIINPWNSRLDSTKSTNPNLGSS